MCDRLTRCIGGPGRAPLLCTEGASSLACRMLVAAAAAGGAQIRWRNDFDWPGLRMTATAVRELGAVPWRMAAADYRSGLARTSAAIPLTGAPAPSPWDPALAEEMTAAGRALMEERLVVALLADLASRPTGVP